MIPKAKYIVIIGPDGCGKTTVADLLARTLEADGRPVASMKFSFCIMPPISFLLGRSKGNLASEGQRDAGMVKPLRRSRAIILAFWYGLDHLMGHWKLVTKREDKREVVIFARSYHDFLYQRAYLKLPTIIPRFFLALGPQPDLVATLKRNSRTINAQKPELTSTEIEKQYARIEARLNNHKYFASIDATDGIDSTVRQIREIAGL